MGEPLNPSSQMQPPPSPPRSNMPMLYYGLVVIGTAAIVLVLYNLVVVKWCSDITQQPQRRTRRSHGSTSSRRALNFIGINFISSFKYERDGDGDSECIVCLSVFEEGEEIRQLPKCKHYFHAPCIDMWLYSHMDCPICRSPVLHQHATTEQSEHSHEVAEQSEQSREGLLDPGMLV